MAPDRQTTQKKITRTYFDTLRRLHRAFAFWGGGEVFSVLWNLRLSHFGCTTCAPRVNSAGGAPEASRSRKRDCRFEDQSQWPELK